jgi:uncharacterized protein YuzE
MNMKITYDPEVDVLRILLSNTAVAESNEAKPGMILDYDKDGNVVGMEILNASKQMENPYAVEYSVIVTQAEKIQSDTIATQQPLSLCDRRAFLQLPLEERRRILGEQAEAMALHYQQDTEWQELQAGDLIEY